MAQQKFPKAYEAYQQAVYRDGRNPTFWCSIGVLYYQINQYRDALDAYSRAIRLNPYISEVWYDLGTLVRLTMLATCNVCPTLTPGDFSTNHATTKQLMRLTHTQELLSWTQRIPTSGQGCSCFAVVIPQDPISTMHPCLRMSTHKRIRTTLVPLPAHSGRVEPLKWHSHLKAKQLQHGSTNGQEGSLIFLLHSNFPNPIPMIKEMDDFKALGPRHLDKNHPVPTKNHPATHQFENSTRHHQR
jgi:tetratricopeptide (TPR) repeat protein